ncbi:Hypothetical protein CINCED_3A003811 [Cinara cedri]|uniref:Uncharacterized protein n=1 Tax=Cinara cedri TaxID=506608 RepID=A0A5E4MA86_9HEMI|nr:Hypothetical protein CINCED_3A003811 [Cinara cedri]
MTRKCLETILQPIQTTSAVGRGGSGADADAVSIRDEQASKTRSARNASMSGGLSRPAMTAWTFAGSFWSRRSVSWRVFPERWKTDVRDGGCDRMITSSSPIWRVTPKHEV